MLFKLIFLLVELFTLELGDDVDFVVERYCPKPDDYRFRFLKNELGEFY